MLMQKFPWNSTEIGVLMFSMEFHGKCRNPPCKYFAWKSMVKFPWNSMEIDVLILHGIQWRIFQELLFIFITCKVLYNAQQAYFNAQETVILHERRSSQVQKRKPEKNCLARVITQKISSRARGITILGTQLTGLADSCHIIAKLIFVAFN